MNGNGKTCGPLYFQARTATGNDDNIRAYAAGFVTGLAEKVYLGACGAAMVRPAPEDYGWLLETVRIVAATYGLTVHEYEYPKDGPGAGKREIWLVSPVGSAGDDWRWMVEIPVNTPGWHAARGRLCGIPANWIDYAFHERQAAT